MVLIKTIWSENYKSLINNSHSNLKHISGGTYSYSQLKGIDMWIQANWDINIF